MKVSTRQKDQKPSTRRITDLCHAILVKHALATGRIAVAVARNASLDLIIVDLRIKHCFDTSFEPQFGVVDLSAWLDELGHAYAEDVAWRFLLRCHDVMLGDIRMPTV